MINLPLKGTLRCTHLLPGPRNVAARRTKRMNKPLEMTKVVQGMKKRPKIRVKRKEIPIGSS